MAVKAWDAPVARATGAGRKLDRLLVAAWPPKVGPGSVGATLVALTEPVF